MAFHGDLLGIGFKGQHFSNQGHGRNFFRAPARLVHNDRFFRSFIGVPRHLIEEMPDPEEVPVVTGHHRVSRGFMLRQR